MPLRLRTVLAFRVMSDPMSLAGVRRFEVQRAIVDESLEALAAFGVHGFERLVLWFGTVDHGSALVTECFVPPQDPIRDESGVGYMVTGETLFAVNRYLSEHRLRLIAQIHSHPREAYHSSTDDAYAIVTQDGGLSLVVPDFALTNPPLGNWARYRLTGGRWTAIRRADLICLSGSKQQ